MSDISLVPVDHQPDFEDASLVPVDHDPFSADGVTQQAQAQPQSMQPQLQQRQSSAAGADLPDVGPPLIGDGGQFSAGTAVGNNVADVASKVAYGMMTQLATLPQRAIDASAEDVQHLGEDGYTPQSIGPAIETALTMMGGSSAVPATANELRAGVAIPRTPASRAAEKGFPGMGTTVNGGPTLAKSEHLYPAAQGQRSVVNIKLTGSRGKDIELANEEGGFTGKPKGYLWHHVDDFDPTNGRATLELVDENAHLATYPHSGSVAQYEKHYGVRYKR